MATNFYVVVEYVEYILMLELCLLRANICTSDRLPIYTTNYFFCRTTPSDTVGLIPIGVVRCWKVPYDTKIICHVCKYLLTKRIQQ
jgi:hypothetical protein